MDEDYLRLLSIFMPSHITEFNRLRADGGKLAHYTSAESALKIIGGETVWLRNARIMNDPFEIIFGADGALAAFASDEGQRFRHALDAVVPGVLLGAAELIDSWDETIRSQSYITSLCIHTGRENERGRLLMLQNYGGPTGVALILNNAPFTSITDALGVYSTAVQYVEPDGFIQRIGNVADGIEANADFLKTCDAAHVREAAFQMFVASMLCVKHAGRNEEREWRVFHVHGLSPTGVVEMASEVVKGNTETVCKVPLKEPGGEVLGVSIASLLHRVVIGPMRNREAVRQQFVDLLTQKGIADAAVRVVLSDTPAEV